MARDLDYAAAAEGIHCPLVLYPAMGSRVESDTKCNSSLSVGAPVDLRHETPTSTMTLPSLFSFSLANTIVEMYHARIYTLLGIVVVFSGVWPYAKLLVIGLAWIAPTSILDCRQRERVLETLDALSKSH